MAAEGTGAQSGIPIGTELYRELLGLAFVLSGSGDVAHDLVHDVVVASAGRVEGAADPTRYLRTAVVNRWRSQLRRRQVAARWSARQRAASPVQPVVLAEWHDQLLALPVRQRAAIVLRYLCDLDDASIAAALDVAPATVRSLVHRGLTTLRKAPDVRP